MLLEGVSEGLLIEVEGTLGVEGRKELMPADVFSARTFTFFFKGVKNFLKLHPEGQKEGRRHVGSNSAGRVILKEE